LEEKIDGFEKRLDQKLEMMDKRIKAEIQDVRERVDKLEIEKDNELDRLTLLEWKEKEYCLRLRGVAEKKEEEIRETIVQMLANLIDWEEERLEEDIERMFRVNSKYASTHQKPRDIAIEFSRKKTKEMILQASYDKKINMEGEDIMIFKEIPLRILKKRKDYIFLTDVLKRNKIPFRWERLEGVSITFQQERYKLNSIQKAKEFLKKYKEDIEQIRDRRESKERKEKTVNTEEATLNSKEFEALLINE